MRNNLPYRPLSSHNAHLTGLITSAEGSADNLTTKTTEPATGLNTDSTSGLASQRMQWLDDEVWRKINEARPQA